MFRRGLIFMVSAWLATSMPANAETITIVADEWCPYNCAQDAELPGYMVELTQRVMKKSGIDVVYKVMPWAKAVEQARRGKYDAIVGANRGDAPDFIFPEVVQGISINQAWVKKDSKWVYKGLPSLGGVHIGVVAGYSYSKVIDPYLRAREAERKLITVAENDRATESVISDLLAGKVDMVMEDKNVIEYYFASRGMPLPIKAVGNPVDATNYDDTYVFVAFSPANPKSKTYAKLMADGMREMRRSGELKEILARYHMSDSYRFLGKPKPAQ